MQGQEIDRNRIGMHVQNREFKNTGFLPIWVFYSQQLEDHRMQKSMVRLSQTTRKCTIIMLLCYYLLVLCLMNRNMKRRRSGNQNSYGFSFKETLKEQILQFSFAPFLCTKFTKSSTIGNFPIPMFFIHFSFQALAILVGRLEQGKSYTKKCFCATSITLDPGHCPTSSTPKPIYKCTAQTRRNK